MTFYVTVRLGAMLKMRTPLPKTAKFSMIFLLASLWMQLGIGVNAIWQSVPVWLASSHQTGAMIVLTAVCLARHNVRACDPRHINNLLGKMKLEDRSKYDKFMRTFAKNPQARQKIN